jgi:uncharacterized membrane protein YheB (UPF0754 family)
MIDHTFIETLKNMAENVVLFGGATMAVLYGLKRVYTIARNVEKLVEHSETSEKSNMTYRNELKKDLEERQKQRDEKFAKIDDNLEKISKDLLDHIALEEGKDFVRDAQLSKITEHVDEMVMEMRPNGGSSMKDVLNQASKKVDEVHTRVAVLEQWKDDNILPTRKPKTRRRKITRGKK